MKSVDDELVPSPPRSQGTKRKQASTPYSCPANDSQGLSVEPRQHAMALIVASPPMQLISAREHLNMEVELDKGDDEMTKKLRMANCPHTDRSAVAAGQPRREQ